MAKSEDMVVSDINIFLHKKKIKSVSMNVNTIKISLKMKKQWIVEYKTIII